MLAARVFAYGAELTPAASAVFLAPEDRATNVSAALANAQLMLSAAQTALLLNPWSDTTPTLARANLLSWPFAAFGFAGVKPAEVVAGSYARSTAATLVQGGEPRRTATSSLPSSVGTDTKHAVIFTTPVDASLLWDAPARFPVFFGPRFSADVLSSTAGVVLTKTSAVSLHATRLTLAPLS